MFGLGMPEIIVILIVALIIFGPDKLPEMARGIGKGIQEFKNLTMGVERQMKDEFDAIIKEGEEAPKTTASSTTQIEGLPPMPPDEVKPTADEAESETKKDENKPDAAPNAEPEEKKN